MASPASIKGHPIHPMLVSLPIGLWIFSLVCDLVVAGGGDAEWRRVALYTLGGGIGGAVLAAVPGLIDLLSLRGASRITGIRHMVLNLAALLVFGASFWLRLQPDVDSSPIIVSALGVVLILVSGWLGGEMVYRQGVASDDRRVSSTAPKHPAKTYAGPERRASDRPPAYM